ncbi:hypothetical protein ACRUKS_07070 [Burkholderia pseudomallei]|uniref:hypothetical protein n=1 Tax=Burkholderia pseudomallei TaxID=28450 RepID=UPI00016AB79B|nr:hypothetical protein [Burkholderia pseudomallei]EEH25169.1 conserved hypothetical protein [Burkholderia pseudomallei Pakistan 9]EEP52071.1 conserved hypothetical protein [Burkholderia pseudomallei MSHR346]ARK70796.1 hypothetical protein BOC38_30225 [Burkholderia pseudomallei]ARL11737.1 hypothetical protein BOC45_23670 [Burkholderia pseudomallei]ARL53345.1 hypothetical protein BOC51_26575 [Burkholderia pseudomallei]
MRSLPAHAAESNHRCFARSSLEGEAIYAIPGLPAAQARQSHGRRPGTRARQSMHDYRALLRA